MTYTFHLSKSGNERSVYTVQELSKLLLNERKGSVRRGGGGKEGRREREKSNKRKDKRRYYFPVLLHRDMVLISCNHYVIRFFMLFSISY